jgi:hypothetical protein
MSTIEVMLDARDLMGIYEVPDYAEASLMEVMRSGIKKMESYAKRNHRFRSRTGALISSISSEIYGLSGRVYIDDFIAPYGVYVHEGQRSWAPDQFIYKAVSALQSSLKSALHKEFYKVKAQYEQETAIFEKEPEIEVVPGVEFKPNYKTPKIPKTVPVKPIPSPVQPPQEALQKKLGITPTKPAPKNKIGIRAEVVEKVSIGKKDYSLQISLFESLRKEEMKSEAFRASEELNRLKALRKKL